MSNTSPVTRGLPIYVNFAALATAGYKMHPDTLLHLEKLGYFKVENQHFSGYKKGTRK